MLMVNTKKKLIIILMFMNLIELKARVRESQDQALQKIRLDKIST